MNKTYWIVVATGIVCLIVGLVRFKIPYGTTIALVASAIYLIAVIWYSYQRKRQQK